MPKPAKNIEGDQTNQTNQRPRCQNQQKTLEGDQTNKKTKIPRPWAGLWAGRHGPWSGNL